MTMFRLTAVALMLASAPAVLAAPGGGGGGGATTLPGCSTGDITLAAIACAGFFAGNQNGGSQPMIDVQQDALEALGLPTGQIPTGYSPVASAGSISSSGEIVFDRTLYGTTYIGIHFGGGAKRPGSSAKIFPNGLGGGTAFYSIDAGTGLDRITLNISAYSNAVVYRTGTPPPSAVPEPATWGLMLLGFGLVGAAARRRRRIVAA